MSVFLKSLYICGLRCLVLIALVWGETEPTKLGKKTASDVFMFFNYFSDHVLLFCFARVSYIVLRRITDSLRKFGLFSAF